MILRRVEMTDFGLYAGRQVLELEPQRDRPVILVGGKNGAGKTTLLEAVRLALYGRRALGYRVGQAEYDDYLKGRIHVGSGGEMAPSATVGLEFDYAESGSVHRYRVERSWSMRGAKIVETLVLEKDGAVIDGVPRDEWSNFLQELIPPGVSQLFFFDGEKIADIARDEPDESLAEAVRGLLGIELVGRLRTDLGLFLARRSRREDQASAAALEGLVRDLEALEARIAEVTDEVADLQSQRQSLARVASNTRQRFVQEGGGAANNRAKLEATRDELRKEIVRREHDVQELMHGALPFAAAPRLGHRFISALERLSAETSSTSTAHLHERIQSWRTGAAGRQADWTPGHWQDLDAFIATLEATPASVSGAITQMDASDRRRALIMMQDARDRVPAEARVLVSELETLRKRHKQNEADLVRANGHAAGVLLDELLVAEKEAGAAEAQHKARVEDLRVLEARRAQLNREQEQALRSQTEAKQGEERAALAVRVGRALQAYEERLLDLKLAQLQSEFVERFNHLARKGGFVTDARIDRNTFDATLIDRSGAEIRKASLSAGEKQIYAIAMLWALARTSGRPLPMIIDTPLARLDSEHRAALVERYFPEASHQVIVLSTDTEIDASLLDRLAPSISHAYRLDYDPEQRATHVSAGYFDGPLVEEQSVALQQA